MSTMQRKLTARRRLKLGCLPDGGGDGARGRRQLTVRLDADVFEAIRKRALRNDTTFSDALAAMLEDGARARRELAKSRREWGEVTRELRLRRREMDGEGLGTGDGQD